jgi:ubiquitin-like modifier-activating enzyme ATG7
MATQNATGHNISIPMPGHAVHVPLMQEFIENAKKLDQFVQEHDVVFLLTDSRESRWFPTLLAAYYNKVHQDV